MRRPAVPAAAIAMALLAALGVAALLLAFQRVVSQGVEQGATRQRAMAAPANASRRCSTLAQVDQRGPCQAQLTATADPETTGAPP